MIADMLSSKNFNSTKTPLLIRGRKLNISLVFATQSYLPYQKLLNSTTEFYVPFHHENSK